MSLRIEDFVIGRDGDIDYLYCPADRCPQPTINAGSTLGAAIKAARDHIELCHLSHPDTRALDREDGIFYAHQNGLDCGRRPCLVCAPIATPEGWI